MAELRGERAQWVTKLRSTARKVLDADAVMEPDDVFARSTTRTLARGVEELIKRLEEKDDQWKAKIADLRKDARKLRRKQRTAELQYTEMRTRWRTAAGEDAPDIPGSPGRY